MLSSRFGTPAHYLDSFIYDMDRSNIIQEFKDFHADKTKSDNYEASRQRFLRLLSQNRMIWQRTNEIHDLDVDIARIWHRDRNEYLAYMRIQPHGFRAVRVVPEGMELVFHVLIGSVIFNNRGRIRNLTKGNSSTVAPRHFYSIRCSSVDQPTILIFRLQKLKKEV